MRTCADMAVCVHVLTWQCVYMCWPGSVRTCADLAVCVHVLTWQCVYMCWPGSVCTCADLAVCTCADLACTQALINFPCVGGKESLVSAVCAYVKSLQIYGGSRTLPCHSFNKVLTHHIL